MGINSTIKCFGCGAVVPDVEGAVHSYMLSIPGCWQLYGEILAKEYEEVGYQPIHRITVDAYAVQHPGKPVRQAIQSVAVHLISLYYVLERGYDFQRATQAMRRALQNKQVFVWLEPPVNMGDITVTDVARTTGFIEHESMVRKWGASAWMTWSKHHDQIRKWAAL